MSLVDPSSVQQLSSSEFETLKLERSLRRSFQIIDRLLLDHDTMKRELLRRFYNIKQEFPHTPEIGLEKISDSHMRVLSFLDQHLSHVADGLKLSQKTQDAFMKEALPYRSLFNQEALYKPLDLHAGIHVVLLDFCRRDRIYSKGFEMVGPFNDQDAASLWGQNYQKAQGDNPNWNRLFLPEGYKIPILDPYRYLLPTFPEDAIEGIYIRKIQEIQTRGFIYHIVKLIGPFESDDEVKGWAARDTLVGSHEWESLRYAHPPEHLDRLIPPDEAVYPA